METEDEREPGEQPLTGCKLAFGCALLLLLILALAFPFSALLLIPNPRDWGL